MQLTPDESVSSSVTQQVHTLNRFKLTLIWNHERNIVPEAGIRKAVTRLYFIFVPQIFIFS
jgi:hypothetical protein